MDTTTATAPVNQVPATVSPMKRPSTLLFGLGVLLFFLPFVDIKCNDMSLQKVSGIQLATGFKTKDAGSNDSMFGTSSTSKSEKKGPNIYALAALGLGLLGLALSFNNAKAAMGGAMATGIGSAAALIGLMLDVKKQVKLDMPSSKGGDSGELGEFGKELTDKMAISVDFTPWFYLAVVAFLAAAFFSYRRMSGSR